MKTIAIIGCGFSGTMTAIQLIKNAAEPFSLVLIDHPGHFNRGIAYNPSSKKQLLNVTAARMSAFQDKPDDFLNWVVGREDFTGIHRDVLANTYLPRYLYGEYLENLWSEALQSSIAQNVTVSIKHALATGMEVSDQEITLLLDNGEKVTAQFGVIATGNCLPGNPDIKNTGIFNHPRYYRNPWDAYAVKTPDLKFPVLILGNGLTMADTVLGLVENGFDNEIHTLSPHGFTTLQHGQPAIGYTAIAGEFHNNRQSLTDLLRIVIKHIRLARNQGLTAATVIDAIRPFTQQIWQNLTIREKRLFLSRLRHLWDTARHRIPSQIHDKLMKLEASGKLYLHSGKLIEITEDGDCLIVRFFDHQKQLTQEMRFSAVINCTGPVTDLMKAESGLLKKCLVNGILVQDELNLGIATDPKTFEVYDGLHESRRNLFAIGPLLKGVLWESTAVKELREQAEAISKLLINKIGQSSGG